MTLFVVDISGSMSATSKVVVEKETRSISRLECVKSAVQIQIKKLSEENPNCVVGLLTFSESVTVYGDGSVPPKTIETNLLSNWDGLLSMGEKLSVNCSNPIYKQSKLLSETVTKLRETGMTALGPALLVALGIASKTNGANIVICTDGVANIGLGTLKSQASGAAVDESFYLKAGNRARENGIVVNVISIKGDDCSVENLGTLADITAGVVDIVESVDLAKGAAFSAKPIVATSVFSYLILNKNLRFTNLDENEGNKDATKQYILAKDIGNATVETDIAFSYEVVPDSAPPEKLSFQTKITYTKLDGSRCVRVTTYQKLASYDREQAEQKVDCTVLGLRAIHESARFAQTCRYTKARVNLISTQRLLQRVMKTKEHQQDYFNYIVQSEKLDAFMREAQQDEGIFGVEIDEDSEEAKKKLLARKAARSDNASKNIYNMKSVSKAAFRNRE